MIRGIPLARSGFSAWQGIEGKWASLKAVSNMLDNLSQNREDNSGKIIIGDKPPEIRLENLYFEYEDRKKSVINSVSLDIKSGSKVALVGPSGAGKSTLIDFIPKLKVPIKGKVLFDGVNINDINVEYLRSKIAFLPQAPQILEGSIRDHVSFGNPEILDVDILKALQKAGCEDLLMKIDHNLALRVGEAGVLLSGGERQRLDLARVLARKASILILDEPASNLDPITEKIIHDAIIKENKERLLTVIVIGHRLKFLNSFDQIIILNNGSIEFKGIHAEALKQSTWYKNAWKL
jgi:ABC-type multidrug transport system fused ATPase/permease subunit